MLAKRGIEVFNRGFLACLNSFPAPPMNG